MDKRITSIVRHTRTILRFYCRCGQMGVARRDEMGGDWKCPKCGESRKIPETSETVLRIAPGDIVPPEGDKGKKSLEPIVRDWGKRLVDALRADNVGVGTAEVNGYYCLKIHLSDDLDEYLRITSLDIEGSQYILLATSAGRMKSSEQAIPLLEYLTQFAKIDLSEDEVRLHWLLPIANLSVELVKEECLSMIFDASMIRTTVLARSGSRR